MYKPPENTNRVRAIKSKFENNENANSEKPSNGVKQVNNRSKQLNIGRAGGEKHVSNVLSNHAKQANGDKQLNNVLSNRSKQVTNVLSNHGKQLNIVQTSGDKRVSNISSNQSKHTNGTKQVSINGTKRLDSVEINGKVSNVLVDRNNVNSEKKVQSSLARQLSDPVKVNIKRTPAFRNDKPFQRSSTQISCRSRGNDARKPCDKKSTSPQKLGVGQTKSLGLNGGTSFSSLVKRFDSQENLARKSPEHALRERSNTSAEIILNKRLGQQCVDNNNKKCFDSQENLNKSLRKNTVKVLGLKEDACYENITMLYTEPIPKSLRVKENNVHNAATLKIGDKISSPVLISRTDDINFKLNALTDTLKLALKKPLPPGPAPKKPPRTFAHNPQSPRNGEFENKLNSTLEKGFKQRKTRGDPKYMLDKLENALKNNKIRLKRQPKIDYTSEEDNCESNGRTSPRLSFNCLQSLGCSNAAYETIEVPKPSVGGKSEEPVYAEPFVFPRDGPSPELRSRANSNKKVNRNSLYYMSSPVTSPNEVDYQDTMNDHGLTNSDAGEETSSISTPTTSDIDSLTSTPSEENKKFMSSKIRDLMKSFEKPSLENRVDRLGMQLRHTIEAGFVAVPVADSPDNEASSERSSTEGENSDAKVGEYENYVRTIRMYSKLRRKTDGRFLFYCCLLVGLDGKQPYIKFRFPMNVDLPLNIEKLCFPDAIDSTIDYTVKAQNYTLVLTNSTGERVYGYCRRVLPEDSTKCLPLAYCILSKQRAARFYRRILEELESRHGIPDKIRDTLLDEFYCHRFPSPGESVRFNLVEVNKNLSAVTLLEDNKRSRDAVEGSERCNGNARKSSDGDVDLSTFVHVNAKGVYGTLNKKNQNDPYNRRNGVFFHNGIIPKELIDESEAASISTPTELVITLHQDSRYKENDLEELCNTLENDTLQRVFASLLLERKVIFISSLLGKLSTCIEAIQSMLYPFSWPHTLIPVVPKDLLELVEAPTPLICGALSLDPRDYVIEHGIVVDLDKGKILKEVGDEGKIIPCHLLKEFKEGMSLAHASSKENECAFNVLLSDAFLRIFIHSCGHYKNYIKDNHFQKDEFIQHPKNKNVRRFLKWFTETTMFCTFIDTVLSNSSSFSIFDKRIQIYSSPDASLILEKMKDWKKEKSYTFF